MPHQPIQLSDVEVVELALRPFSGGVKQNELTRPVLHMRQSIGRKICEKLATLACTPDWARIVYETCPVWRFYRARENPLLVRRVYGATVDSDNVLGVHAVGFQRLIGGLHGFIEFLPCADLVPVDEWTEDDFARFNHGKGAGFFLDPLGFISLQCHFQ